MLCVSQFTLYGRLKGAGKPDYSKAMPPKEVWGWVWGRVGAGVGGWVHYTGDVKPCACRWQDAASREHCSQPASPAEPAWSSPFDPFSSLPTCHNRCRSPAPAGTRGVCGIHAAAAGVLPARAGARRCALLRAVGLSRGRLRPRIGVGECSCFIQPALWPRLISRTPTC